MLVERIHEHHVTRGSLTSLAHLFLMYRPGVPWTSHRCCRALRLSHTLPVPMPRSHPATYPQHCHHPEPVDSGLVWPHDQTAVVHGVSSGELQRPTDRVRGQIPRDTLAGSHS